MIQTQTANKAYFENISKLSNVSLVLIFFIVCTFLSAVIPPLKSPDEPDHIERAYLLGKGVLILERPEGKSSGGRIDTGLTEYLSIYLPNQDKLSAEEIEAASEIKWTGERIYNESPGTGYYFPIIYLPQASGLLLGEFLGFTIDYSYRLSRMFSLFVICLLFLAAFRIQPVNPLVLALIAMPMSLFQFSSASLDGTSTALAIFAISVFLRIAKDKENSPKFAQFALAIAVIILTTSRLHTLPFFILLASSFFYTKKSNSLYIFIFSASFVVTWTLVALLTTVDMRGASNAPALTIVTFYVQNPFQFASVLLNTLSDSNNIDFYVKSFIGILGWLDAPFDIMRYFYFKMILLSIAAFSISFSYIRKEWQQRLLIIVTSLISVVFIFFALLVTWTWHPADKILGVQGRYFLVPAILLAYGIASSGGLVDCRIRKFATFQCLLFFIFSIYSVTSLLIARYYITPFKQEIDEIEYNPNGASDVRKMVPSVPLGIIDPIVIHIPQEIETDFGKIRRVGVLFGTYRRQNTGVAELSLRTDKGKIFRHEFMLDKLIDNGFKYFIVPDDFYVSGEIRFVSGGGISAWESHSTDGHYITCVKPISSYNKIMTVRGCS